ncbi:hypothetical protein SAMN04515620_1114 [Collimonas sp. OK607]|uniref:rolling circle replication-associated protein n=1 Tax=Collimonas sp. OK607 TaxID=1798194 RepID=UPI0008EC4890|nr:hypothetical protein [Collimonas sp. OK607]SFA98612.1 hypothetical protein SAMN04515620_1114 [Collimonas sp. OK607]
MGKFAEGVAQYEKDFQGVQKKNSIFETFGAKPFDPLEMVRDELRYKRLRRNIGVAAKLHEISVAAGRKNHNVVMVTLTYEVDSWDKKHMGAYLTNVRNWMFRRTGEKLKYVWVAEMQKRGVIHYHVLYWMPRGITMPKADKQGWWPHGSTKTEKANKPVAYAMKYASKLDSKEGFPDGARTYGVGGLVEADRSARRWFNFPGFIKARAAVGDCWKRSVGGGWLEHATGQLWPSEWGICLVTKLRLSIVRLHDHGRPLDVGGPFSWLKSNLKVEQIA